MIMIGNQNESQTKPGGPRLKVAPRAQIKGSEHIDVLNEMETTITLATLVTVISGPNDAGKSRRLRALRNDLEKKTKGPASTDESTGTGPPVVHIEAKSNLAFHPSKRSASARKWAEIEKHLTTKGRGQTLLLEHPGALLHPCAQSELADIIAEHAKRYAVRVVIETHSEAFVRRLQRRVAEGRYRCEEIRLYATSKTGEESRLDNVGLNDYGAIERWPAEWFGDQFAEIVALSVATHDRHTEKT